MGVGVETCDCRTIITTPVLKVKERQERRNNITIKRIQFTEDDKEMAIQKIRLENKVTEH